VLANVGQIFVFIKESLLVQGRVKRLVIVHFKIQTNVVISKDLGCLWVPRSIVHELWGALNTFYIIGFKQQTQRIWLLKVLDLIVFIKKKIPTIFPTYFQAMHTLSMYILKLTHVTNPCSYQTISNSNQSLSLEKSNILI
jgi:hypothetical protein